VLHLILSPDLNLRFLYPPDAATSFKPGPEHVGQPIEAARLLIAADPGLPLDCRAAVKGADVPPRRIGAAAGEGYLRRIVSRLGTNGEPIELIVTYEVGTMTARLELARVRSRLSGAIAAVPDPVAYFDETDRLVLCNGAYGRMYGADRHEGLPAGHLKRSCDWLHAKSIKLRVSMRAGSVSGLKSAVTRYSRLSFDSTMGVGSGKLTGPQMTAGAFTCW